VFGKVVEGMETVDKIRAIATGPQGPFARDVPTTAVVIDKAEVLPAAAAPAAVPAEAAPATPPPAG
jgi:peptidyl-prolyl cis-trans isomerase A (cyclophilin A)